MILLEPLDRQRKSKVVPFLHHFSKRRFPTSTILPLSWPYGGPNGISDIRKYHEQQIQFNVAQSGGIVGALYVDPVTAAFGGFSFYAIPVGHAKKVGAYYEISVWQAYIHVMDSFDFNGTQPLGCWGEPADAGYTWVPGRTCVFNSTFQWYRRMKARGEDYNLFTLPTLVQLKDSAGNNTVITWTINQ